MNSIAFLNEMHLTPYSAAAYAVAWLIYLGYLGRILLRMKKVAAERAELERTQHMSHAVIEPPATAARR